MNISVINELTALPIFHQDPMAYLSSAMIFLVTIVLAWLVTYIFKNYLEKIAKRTETDLDDIILEKIKRRFLSTLSARFEIVVVQYSGGRHHRACSEQYHGGCIGACA